MFYLPKSLRFAKWVVIFIPLKQVRESIQTQIFHIMVDFEGATKFRVISPVCKFQDCLVKITIKCKVRVAMTFQSYSLDPCRKLRLITPLNSYGSRLCLLKSVLQQWPWSNPNTPWDDLKWKLVQITPLVPVQGRRTFSWGVRNGLVPSLWNSVQPYGI